MYVKESGKLKSVLDLLKAPGQQPTTTRVRHHLCPKCTATLTPAVYVCPSCRLEFKPAEKYGG